MVRFNEFRVVQISYPRLLGEAKCETKCTQLVEKKHVLKYRVYKNHTALPAIRFSNVKFPPTHLLFLIYFVVRIHNSICVRTPYNLVHGYEYFGGAFWVCLHRPSEDGGSASRRKISAPKNQSTRSYDPEYYSFEIFYDFKCILKTGDGGRVGTAG
jgi:hypothetical protein